MIRSLILPCIFGCGAGCEDDLYHYVRCPMLWSLAQSRTRFAIPHHGLERLGISNPCKQILHMLSAIFQAYHGTKTWVKAQSDYCNIHTLLQQESFCVSVRKHFTTLYSTCLRGMPGEESSVVSSSNLHRDASIPEHFHADER